MSSCTRTHSTITATLLVWILLIVMSATGWAAPSGNISYPVSGGVYSSIGYIQGLSTGATQVKAALGRVTAAGVFQYWNWGTQQWGAWDWNACQKPATGVGSWYVNAGLPTLWDNQWLHYAYAYFYDSTGAYSSRGNYFYIGASGPAVGITFPFNGASYNYASLDHISGTASPGGGTLDRVEVHLFYRSDSGQYNYWRWGEHAWGAYDEAKVWKVATGTSSWSVTSDLPPYWWLYGQYTVYARAFNTNGARSPGYATSSFRVASSDTLQPDVAVTYPVQSQWYYPGPASISGTASDNLSGVGLVEVYLAWNDAGTWKYWRWDGTWETAASAAARKVASGTSPTWELTGPFPTWVQGNQYAVAALATDHVGWTRLSPWVYFYAGDHAAPAGAITDPVNGGSYYPGLTRIAGIASNGETGVNHVDCELWMQIGTNTWQQWNWATATWETPTGNMWKTATGKENWELTTGFPDPWPCPSWYSVRARIYDNAGNSAYTSWVGFWIRDNTPPDSITITKPVQDASYYPTEVEFNGTAHDADSGVASVGCMLAHEASSASWLYWNWVSQAWETYDYSRLSEFMTTADGTDSWSVTAGLPTAWPCNKRYWFYAEAKDRYGNGRYAYAYFNIIDPIPPSGTITYPEAKDYFPGISRIAGTASNGHSGVNRVDCLLWWYDSSAGVGKYWNWGASEWQLEYTTDTCWKLATGKENWELTSGFPSTWPCPERYVVYGRVFDNAGNWAYTDGVSFWIRESVPPTVTIDTPEQDEWYLPGAAQFAGTASDAGGLREVTCMIAYEGAATSWLYWNWDKAIFEAYDVSRWQEFSRAANGKENWQVTSGLPTTWPCCKRYWFSATARDMCGNYSYDYVYFYIGDKIAPVINSVTATPNRLWPPNHEMVNVQVTVDATDNFDPAPVSRITGVSCNEPADGSGDGNTSVDIEITGPLTVRLRSERDGSEGDRVYTIDIVCTDACGNASTDSVTVTAPHDRGG